MPLPLSEIFPDTDYRFHLTLRRGQLADFFSLRRPAILEERRRWLSEARDTYALAQPGSEEVINEFAATVASWPNGRIPTASGLADASQPAIAQLLSLGNSLEPDFVLLTRDAAGISRATAGVVCFPSSWALEEKMGLTLDEIHGVVPGLNLALGPALQQFIARLKPDQAYERANWGLAATPELNLHPALSRPRLHRPLDPDRSWVRVEDQILGVLPASSAVVFGIALRIWPLAELLGDPALRRGFHRAVTTMPAPLAQYKGLWPVMDDLRSLSRG